jgi:hypothetical protein
MSTEHAEFFAKLRASTARLLSLDIDSLSPADATRVDRAAVLRLSLDKMQSAALAGAEVDLKNFISASSELERLFGGVPERDQSRFGPSHREKLQALIENVVRGSEAQEAEDEATTALKDEAAAIAASSPDGVERAERLLISPDKNCASGDAQSDVRSPSPAPAAPAGATPTPRAETDIERMNRVNSTPANPAPGPREEWRNHIGPGGEIIAPYFRG